MTPTTPMTSSTPANSLDLDVAIVGGGAAGLWLLNRLLGAGYQAALFEARALGSDQTLASQGMIHGGIKYTLKGALTGASEAIAGMPARWRACLAGRGELNLGDTAVLSEHFYLWSGKGVSSRMSTFLASRVTRGRVSPVPAAQRPSLLQHPDFSGSLYRLEDLVLDMPSLLANLTKNASGRLFLAAPDKIQLRRDAGGNVSLRLATDGGSATVRARRLILTAGKGNAALLQQLGLAQPAMQLRPLHQVMVKHRHPHRFYGHCLGADTTPRLTVSSHPMADGQLVWYLGGSLAEKGVGLDAKTQIELARVELARLFPWLNLADARWATLTVDRAEPRQPRQARPDGAYAKSVPGCANLRVAWPTKLTLVPNLADQLLADLGAPDPSLADGRALAALRAQLAVPPLAATPWDTAFAESADAH